MNLYRITLQGEGFELYEVEAETEAEARELIKGEWPLESRVEGAEFLSAEVIEEDL